MNQSNSQRAAEYGCNDAVIRGSSGPLREVQAGGGYWSQNSYTQTIPILDETSLVFNILGPDGQRISRTIDAPSDQVTTIRLYEP